MNKKKLINKINHLMHRKYYKFKIIMRKKFKELNKILKMKKLISLMKVKKKFKIYKKIV